jgi:hypothetical protein
MRLRLLTDEVPTRQDVHLRALADLGVDLGPYDETDTEDIAWGSDPFDILVHREAAGLTDHD